METKSIIFPYLPQLDKFVDEGDLDAIVNTLDSKGNRQTIDHVNWDSEYPYRPLTAVTVAHSGRYLYLDFFVRCNYMRAVNTEDQSPVSEDSCVEFFVSPDSSDHYWNFEFNCIGTINASHRTERHNPTRLSHEMLSQVLRYASCGNRPFCELEGLFTWNLLVAIPLSLIGLEFKGQEIKISGNFYKCASRTSAPHYLSWNPIHSEHPDFLRPDCFGTIILSSDQQQ